MDAGAILMVIGIFGNATGLFFFLAPICTFNRIIISKSIEHFSGVPYVMTLLNCLLSAWYGLPFVSQNNMLVTIVNGIGAVFESIYVIIFLIFAPKKEKHKTLALLIFVLVVFSVVALVSIFALREKQRNFFCGYVSTFFSILMYASPLSVTRMVIKTKSVEYMPFFLSLFAFLCGTSWFVYGLLEKDLFVAESYFFTYHLGCIMLNEFIFAVPNGFGCVLGALQLILYAIYYDRECPAEKTSTCESVESGLENGKPHQQNPSITTDSPHHEHTQVSG